MADLARRRRINSWTLGVTGTVLLVVLVIVVVGAMSSTARWVALAVIWFAMCFAFWAWRARRKRPH